jgi:uncharacterized protein YkwD
MLALASACAVAAPASAIALSNGAYEARLFALLNAERAAHGLHRLAPTRCAADYATRWAEHIAHDGVLRHQPLGRIVGGCRASRAAENIAYGNVTPEKMMDLWMHSSGHRRNILDPHLTHVGLGAERDTRGAWYGVQVFLGY